MRPHRSSRTDANHAQIVAALRKAGIRVQSLAGVGDGCPDLLCACRGVNVLLEVKAPDGKLRADQVRFIESWSGPVFVVTSPEDAILKCVEAARPKPHGISCACGDE